jgi:hypothetical protein
MQAQRTQPTVLAVDSRGADAGCSRGVGSIRKTNPAILLTGSRIGAVIVLSFPGNPLVRKTASPKPAHASASARVPAPLSPINCAALHCICICIWIAVAVAVAVIVANGHFGVACTYICRTKLLGLGGWLCKDGAFCPRPSTNPAAQERATAWQGQRPDRKGA